ncbi:MAG: ABC transporter permease [Candidatus Fimadaptatus sp.]
MVTPAVKSHTALSRLRRSFKQHWILYLLLVVPLAYIITFAYTPMVGLLMAFEDYRPTRGIFGSKWVGLKHFERFLSMPSFFTLLRNTVVISLYSMVAGFPMPIILALALNEVRMTKLKKTVQMVSYAPYFISTVVMVGIIMQFFSTQFGPVNILRRNMGLSTINFMGEQSMFRSIYVWSGVWQGSGYGAVIYIAAIAGIDPQLHEAALIDGANRFQRLWHVDIPGILPTVVIMLIMNCGSIMSVGYEKIYLMQNSLNTSVSEVISTYVYKVGLKEAQYSFSAAVGMFNSVVNFIMLVLVNGISRRVSETSLW